MLWPWPWKNGWAPGLLIGKLVLEASLQIQKQILLNPSSPFSSLGVSTPLTGSDFSSVVAVSWAWSDEAMPELSDFPKRSGDTAKVRKLRLMKPVQDATWGTPWWRVDELAAHLLRREDRKRESIVFCRWDVFECVWTENGGARKHRICGVFWNALSRAVACFMLLMAFWCPPSNNPSGGRGTGCPSWYHPHKKMAKKKNSGYLKNFERNSGIGRNEKKKKK